MVLSLLFVGSWFLAGWQGYRRAGIHYFMSEITLVKVKDHNSDLTDFQHIAFWEIMVTEVEGDCKS